MELKLTISKQGKFFEGKPPEILKRNLESALYEATQFLEKEVKERTPQGVFGAQGGLASTVHGEVAGKGAGVMKGIVGHGSKYGDVIEKGRTAGQKMPPPGALVRWMEVKLGMSPSAARRREYAVRKKIAEKGFKGVRMFERAFDENLGKLRKIFDHYGFEIAREMGGE